VLAGLDARSHRKRSRFAFCPRPTCSELVEMFVQRATSSAVQDEMPHPDEQAPVDFNIRGHGGRHKVFRPRQPLLVTTFLILRPKPS